MYKRQSEYRQIWDCQVKQYLQSLLDLEIPVVYCGDLNVVHQPHDIYDSKIWYGEKHCGVLGYEKKGMCDILETGYIDAWRYFNPIKPNEDDCQKKYTWWNPRVKARMRGIGWRIDYFVIREKDTNRIKEVDILDNVLGSDHCPIYLELI